VLNDADASLRSLIEATVSRNGSARTRVVFDPPTPEWAAGQSGSVLNLFLYDIREDRDGRGSDEVDVRDDQGHVIGRRPPIRKYQLSYLVSAWAKDPDEEHRMLGSILASIPDLAAIPDDHLKGRFEEQGLAVNIDVAVPVTGAQTWDLWGALGTPPRTAVEIVLTAPVLPELRTDLAPPAEKLDLGVSRDPNPPEGLGAEPEAEAKPKPASRRTKREGGEPAQEASKPAPRSGPPVEPRPGNKWATFRVREHAPAEPGD
jgi:hypothetical protein